MTTAAEPNLPALSITRTVADLRDIVAGWRKSGETVALVPTMGALHAAHVALLEDAQKTCDRTVITIFVNPAQFGPDEDFDAYPRREARDIEMIEAAHVDLLLAPSVTEIYPDGFATTVAVAGISDGLCGDHRPGHFDGVATVVTKLLLQSLPDVAMFGEKDYQQLQVIRRLVSDLDIPVRIQSLATVRAEDGLAISSRNVRLRADERAIAPRLYAVLGEIAARIAEGTPPDEAVAAGLEALRTAGFNNVEYLEVRDAETLKPAADQSRALRVLAAVWLGETRLIDNVPVA
jgi:pantoate--beta-alanine ligase